MRTAQRERPRSDRRREETGHSMIDSQWDPWDDDSTRANRTNDLADRALGAWTHHFMARMADLHQY